MAAAAAVVGDLGSFLARHGPGGRLALSACLWAAPASPCLISPAALFCGSFACWLQSSSRSGLCPLIMMSWGRILMDGWLQKKDGDAGSEWVLIGGEMIQEEMPGLKDKDKNSRHKTLLLAAVRVAASDVGHCAEMPETDFQSIGGKKERLPPSMLKMTQIR